MPRRRVAGQIALAKDVPRLLRIRDHIAERRGKALDEVLEEMASLDRLRRLVANLRGEDMSRSTDRVAEFLALFGDDDDHAFRPPYGYY